MGDTALIRGIGAAVKWLAPAVKLVGVQAEGAPAYARSWREGRVVTTEACDTVADGLATRNVYEMTFPSLREGLTGFVKVSESAIAEALRLLLRITHNLAEGAGAASKATAKRCRGSKLNWARSATIRAPSHKSQDSRRRPRDPK